MMEETIYEMEYCINGEKYHFTCTKMGETTPKETNELPVDVAIDPELLNKFAEMPEVEEDDLLRFSVEDIPEGMDIETWLNIIDNYGIILIK